MNILLITRQFPYPLRDGESFAIQMMSKGLVESGAKVDLLALNTSKHYYEFKGSIPSDLAQYNEIHTVDVDNRVKVSSALMNLLSKESYHISRYQSQEVRTKLKHIIGSSDYDIIQLEGLHLLTYISMIRGLSKAKVVYRAHNVESTVWQRLNDQSGSIVRKYYLKEQVKRLRHFEINAIKAVDCICAVSEEDGAFFMQQADVPVKVVPIGIELNQQFIRSKESNIDQIPRIGFIGSLDWRPNQEGLRWYIKEVHAKLVLQKPKYQLIIAGRKSELIKGEFSQLPKVVWMGEVADANDFWSEIDLLIVPLFAGSGTRVKIIEALAKGKHVITTLVGIEGINYEGLDQITVVDTAEDWQDVVSKALSAIPATIDRESLENWLHNMGYKKIGQDLFEYYQDLKNITIKLD